MIHIKKNLKKIALTLAILNILNYSFSFNKNLNVQARTKSTAIKNEEHLTIKRWFINQFKKDPDIKNLAKTFNNMTDEEKANKNNKNMKKIKTSFNELIKEYQKIGGKKVSEISETTNKFTKESFVLPDYLKPLFREFWKNDYIENAEEKFVLSKIPKKNNKNNPVLYITPGFGFEEKGAVHGKVTTKQLNAVMTHKIIKNLLDEGIQIYTPLNLKYADLELPKHKNLHVIFNERPPIIGKSRSGKIFEATTKIMRNVMKKTLDENKNSKFCSLGVFHDSSSDKKVVGCKVYYQVDENTYDNIQKESEKLGKLLINHLYNKNEEEIYGVPEEKGNQLSKKSQVRKEDWALANDGEKLPYKISQNFKGALDVLFLGNTNNKAQLKKLTNKKLQDKAAKGISKAISKYLKNK